jgi:hypothetical protein
MLRSLTPDPLLRREVLGGSGRVGDGRCLGRRGERCSGTANRAPSGRIEVNTSESSSNGAAVGERELQPSESRSSGSAAAGARLVAVMVAGGEGHG